MKIITVEQVAVTIQRQVECLVNRIIWLKTIFSVFLIGKKLKNKIHSYINRFYLYFL